MVLHPPCRVTAGTLGREDARAVIAPPTRSDAVGAWSQEVIHHVLPICVLPYLRHQAGRPRLSVHRLRRLHAPGAIRVAHKRGATDTVVVWPSDERPESLSTEQRRAAA